MLINEFKFCASNKNIKVDGVKIKGIASGGDMWIGRKNFQDDVEFFIEAKPIIFANDMPPVEPVDTLTTCIEFNTTKQFISQEAYNEKLKHAINMDKYVIEDDDIKNKISTDDYIYSFWKILEKHFENKKLQPAFQVFEEDGITLEEYIEKNYIITKDPKDRIPLKSIKLDISNPLYNFSIGKVKTEFIKTYGAKEHRNEDGIGLTGVKFKNSQNLNTDYDEENEI
jgi:hypothetical protein